MTTLTTIEGFQTRAQQEWGDVRRTHSQLFDRGLAQISDWVEFPNASSELKMHLAETILRESPPNRGAFVKNGDAHWFIYNFGHDISVIDPPFDGRRVPVMKSALMLLAYAHFNLFSSCEQRAESGDE